MTPTQWDHLKALLDDVLDRPAAERAAVLDRLGHEDPVVRDELLSLLEAYDEAPDYLENDSAPSMLHVPAGEAILETATSAEERSVGPYRLLREIGRGGMGAVYLALRADEHFQKVVALKLIRGGLGSEDVLWRFFQERQILAGLDHPNIARLLDGGSSEHGQPYFVMEYVAGMPIDDYAAQRQLSVEERIRLFLTVCGAVAYAHRNLIVHRDLKPSNILVTEEGTVKLLDFGIAKLLSEERPDAPAPVLTQTGLRAMTPEYAAPEQVRGEPTTTATDVYALGVVLYELLTGRRPYILPPDRSPSEIERIICETEPHRPSQAVTRPATGEGRPTERLRRQLAGDLDTIVLTALHKEPARRYPSVERLADDLQRHLDGLPILARRDTLGYRSRKFVQRHRWGVGGAALVGVLLVGFSVLMAVQAQRTARERDRAEAIVAFLQSILVEADPAQGRGTATPIGDVLHTASLRVTSELAEQPAVQAALMGLIGEVYTDLGDFAAAEPLLREALARRQALYGSDHPDVALSLSHLGAWAWHTGDYPMADSLLTRALHLQGGADPATRAAALNRLGDLYVSQGRFDAADSLLNEALRIRRRRHPGDHASVADNLNSLAYLHQGRRELAEGTALMREALAMRRRLLGNEHPDIGLSLNDLGDILSIYLERDSLLKAEPLFREALALNRNLYGDRHPQVASTLNNLGGLLVKLNRLNEAQLLLEEVVLIKREVFGSQHPSLAVSLNNLAHLRMMQEDFDDAEVLMREALAINRTMLGPDHPTLALMLWNLGELRKRQDDRAGAVALLQEALPIYQAALGRDHSESIWTQLDIGILLHDLDRCAVATPLLQEGLAAPTDVLAGIPSTGWARHALGACLLKARQYEEAETWLLQAREAVNPERDPANARRIRDDLDRLYRQWDKPATDTD